ncbi:MAG: histidine--tRNA ligase [Deferribacterota bacterium]|nr:histidine--tRNA ligase [Deferribacterota bacterium]
MNQGFKKVKGFRDIWGKDIPYWNLIEHKIFKLLKNYNYEEVKLPVLEKIEVFKKGLGDSSDIVEKEMFSFIDKDGCRLALRPEGTASVVRFFIENNLYNENKIHKFYYYGPMFRREKPQKGRFRQFFQAGVEAIGSRSPLLDAEVIKLISDFFEQFSNMINYNIEINSVGCLDCRKVYINELNKYLETRKFHLCENCINKIKLNPLRVFDCKNDRCKEILKNAPNIMDYYCPSCKMHFDDLLQNLELYNVSYKINPRLVRGLDYYTNTAFEVISDFAGAPIAIGAGGRYDGLIKNMGGPDIAGIGFAIGIDRLVDLLKECGMYTEKEFLVFVIYQRSEFIKHAVELAQNLRQGGIPTSIDYDMVSIKSQFKMANKLNVDYAVVIGEDELNFEYYTLKNMTSGEQVKIEKNNLLSYLKRNMEGKIVNIVR